MRPLKICIFTETYYPEVGGGETQARALAESLVANGFSVILITRRSNSSFKRIECVGSVVVYRLPPAGKGHLKKWGLLFTSLPALIKLRRQYDLIFVSGYRVIGTIAVLVSNLLGKACILKADSLGEMSGTFFRDGLAKVRLSPSFFPFRLFLFLRNKILKHANLFVAISSEVEKELLSHSVNPGDIQIIPNSVDTKKFHPVSNDEKLKLRIKLGLPRNHIILIYTGRLVSYKGLPLLLDVWQKIRHKYNNVNLLLVGSGSLDIHNCESNLKEFVKQHGLQESVCFAGALENVHYYLQASDIFVFPTLREAFGISLIEAMACGLPVVSTHVGGIKDILQQRYNGLVAKPGNFQEFYDSLDALINDTLLSNSLGKEARQTAENKYSTRIVTQGYIEIFKNLSAPCN
jgi:glycosyltransferase involved in cell wall biosynthesis